LDIGDTIGFSIGEF